MDYGTANNNNNLLNNNSSDIVFKNKYLRIPIGTRINLTGSNKFILYKQG